MLKVGIKNNSDKFDLLKEFIEGMSDFIIVSDNGYCTNLESNSKILETINLNINNLIESHQLSNYDLFVILTKIVKLNLVSKMNYIENYSLLDNFVNLFKDIITTDGFDYQKYKDLFESIIEESG